MKSLVITLLFIITSSAHAGKYDQEINLLIQNHQNLIKSTGETFEQALKFQRIWHRIDVSLDLFERELQHFSTSTNQNIPSKDELLKIIIKENLLTSSAMSNFSPLKAEINSRIIESQKICSQVGWLCNSHQRQTSSVTSQMNALEKSISTRRKRAQALLNEWHQRQLKEWSTQQAELKAELVNGVEVDRLVNQARAAIAKMKIDAMASIMNDSPEEAQDLVNSLKILINHLPVFFADKILSEPAREALNNLINSSIVTEQELRKLLKEFSGNQQELRAFSKNVKLLGINDKGTPKSDDYEGEADDIFADVSKNPLMIYQNGRLVEIDFSKDNIFDDPERASEKVANGYEGKEGAGDYPGIDISPGDQGLVRFEGGTPRENVKIDGAAEVQQQVENAIRGSVDGNGTGRDSRSEHHFNTADRVADLLDRGRNQVNEAYAEEYEKLRQINEDLRRTSLIFDHFCSKLGQDFQNKASSIDLKLTNLNNLFSAKRSIIPWELTFPPSGLTQISRSSQIKPDLRSYIQDQNNDYAHSLDYALLQKYFGAPDPLQSIPGATYRERSSIYRLQVLGARLKNAKEMTPSELIKHYYELYKIAELNKIKKNELLNSVTFSAPIGSPIFLPEQIRLQLQMAARILTMANPTTSLALDIYTLLTGKDFFTQKKISDREYLALAVMLVVGDNAPTVARIFGGKLLEKLTEISLTGGSIANELGLFGDYFSKLSEKMYPQSTLDRINYLGEFLFGAVHVPPVEDKDGYFKQSLSKEALIMRAQVITGSKLYQETPHNNFWSLSPNYNNSVAAYLMNNGHFVTTSINNEVKIVIPADQIRK